MNAELTSAVADFDPFQQWEVENHPSLPWVSGEPTDVIRLDAADDEKTSPLVDCVEEPLEPLTQALVVDAPALQVFAAFGLHHDDDTRLAPPRWHGAVAIAVLCVLLSSLLAGLGVCARVSHQATVMPSSAEIAELELAPLAAVAVTKKDLPVKARLTTALRAHGR